jgi:hypothetical protein
MWKDATVHHPEAFGLPSIHNINVSPTITATGPNTIDPTRAIKAIHALFIYFFSCFRKLLNKQVLYFD